MRRSSCGAVDARAAAAGFAPGSADALQVAADARSAQWYALLQLHHLLVDHSTGDRDRGDRWLICEGRAQRWPPRCRTAIMWRRRWRMPRRARCRSFFRSKLGEIDEPTAPFGLLDVHGDGSGSRRPAQAARGGLARRLRGRRRRLGVSAATLFHAAWALVVARTSGREDVVFGTRAVGTDAGRRGRGAQPRDVHQHAAVAPAVAGRERRRSWWSARSASWRSC